MHKYIKLFILFILLTFGVLHAQDIPDPMSPPRLVNDFAGILTNQQNNLLEQKLRYYHDSTSTQLYVVIVPSLNGYDKAQFAIELGEKWGIGQQGKDNGAVLLVKPPSGNEKGEVFISTGYGLEATLTDALCRRIIEKDIIPYFKQNKYYEGINAGTDRIIEILSGQFEGDGGSDDYVDGFDVFLNIVIALALILIVVAFIKRGGRGGGGFTSSGRRISTTSSSGRSSSGGGRSSMPKFGGGGGGRFGGGGAGGSW